LKKYIFVVFLFTSKNTNFRNFFLEKNIFICENHFKSTYINKFE